MSGEILQEMHASLDKLSALSLSPDARGEVEHLRHLAGTLLISMDSFDEQIEQRRKESIEERASFISTMTHELRLPLTSIKGYTDLLRQGAAGQLNDQQMGFLGVIRNNVDRMTQLIADLSDISKLDSGRMKIDVLPLSVTRPLEKALRDLYPQLHDKGHRLNVQIPEDTPPVLSNPERLIQIFTNLIRNASMYTPEEGKIFVHAERNDGMVRLEVSDNGIGINEEDQDRLLTPFFRSDDPMVRQQPGWGLGLYLVSRLVDAMGGKVGWVSNVGEGSTFWVTLPAASTE